jgi:hypothetical protein
MRLVLLVLIFAAANIASAAADCASGPFLSACNDCTFDAKGKMDQACWKSYESEGKTCLATAYPMMAIKHQFSGCEQLDTCVQRLSACKEAHKSGSDLVDCKNQGMIECFIKADNCAEAASRVCADGETEEQAGFNNESAGGPVKSVPNITKNETKNESTDVYTEDEMADFFCEGMYFVLLLLVGTFFIKKE